jgi:hypothetical protein
MPSEIYLSTHFEISGVHTVYSLSGVHTGYSLHIPYLAAEQDVRDNVDTITILI